MMFSPSILLTRCVLLYAFIRPAWAAVNVFVFGDYVQNQPEGTLLLTVVVVFLTICMELMFHLIDHKIKNQYVRKIVLHIFEELKMLGIISLFLTLFTSLLPPDGNLYTLGFYLFEWAHMLLFVFAIVFCAVVGTFFLMIRLTWRQWLKNEDQLRKASGDMAQVAQTPSMVRFAKVVRLFSIQITEIHPHYSNISFCRYLKKNQRRNLVFVIAMNWKSWAALGVISLMNSIRGWALHHQVSTGWEHVESEGQSWGDANCLCSLCPSTSECTHGSYPYNLLLFICVVGFGPLCVFLVQYLHLWHGYRHFLTHEAEGIKLSPQSNTPNGDIAAPLLEGCSDEDGVRHGPVPADHKKYFWFRKPDLELQLLQIVLIYEVYYLCVYMLSMIWEVIHHWKNGDTGRIAGVIMLLGGLTPPFIFIAVTPISIQILTILASTGNLLDRQVLQDIYTKDVQQREAMIQQVKDTETEYEEEEDPDKATNGKRATVGNKHVTISLDDTKLNISDTQTPASFSELIMARAQQREQNRDSIQPVPNDPSGAGADTL